MIAQTLQELNQQAEQIRNTEPQSVHTMEVGDEFRQGDLRIIRLADDFTIQHVDKLESTDPVAQLALGTTQGSRHILANVEGVKFYRLKNATPLDGPVIKTDMPNSITHPEHGDVVDLPAGCYAFPGQRQYAKELRRVAD